MIREERPHEHRCQKCGTPTECHGELEPNWDGFPVVICRAFHLDGGQVDSKFLCASCRNLGVLNAHDHGNCELCDAIEARLNYTSVVLDKLRGLVEQWRLEELREREDFPDEARKVARCRHQLHSIVEQFRDIVQAGDAA